MSGLYRGRVSAIDSDGTVVFEFPQLAPGCGYRGVVRLHGGQLAVGDRVVAASLGTSRDELVVVGRVTSNNFGDWVAPIAALNTNLVNGLAAANLRIDNEAAARAAADGTLNTAVVALQGRATALEGRATALEGRATASEGRLTTNESAVATKVSSSLIGSVNGVASLDAGGRLPAGQLTAHNHPAVDRGAWAANTAYTVGDVVSVSGFRWLCRVTMTSGATFNPANWVQVGTVQQPSVGPWATSAFTAVNNSLTTPLATLTVPAQPYPWRPRVSGIVEAKGYGGSVVGVWVRLGAANTGVPVGRGASGNVNDPQQVVIGPWFSIPTTGQTAPADMPGVVAAGAAQQFTVWLARDFGSAAVSNTTLLPYLQVWVDFV